MPFGVAPPNPPRHRAVVFPEPEALIGGRESPINHALHVLAIVQDRGLVEEGAHPAEEELPIRALRPPGPSGRRGHGANLRERVDPLRHVATRGGVRLPRPGPGESLRFRKCPGHAGKGDRSRMHLTGQEGEGTLLALGRDDRVEGWPHKTGADCLAVVLNQPQVCRPIGVRMLHERAGDAQDEIVSRLVGEQEREGA
jgi:hypothetical protein